MNATWEILLDGEVYATADTYAEACSFADRYELARHGSLLIRPAEGTTPSVDYLADLMYR